MNIKDIVIPLTFAVGITLAMQYFFGPKVQEITKQSAGQRIEMQQMQEITKPMNLEVEFASQGAQPEQVSEVVTSYGHLEFSSLGGCLKNVTYHRTVDGKSIDLTTIIPSPDYEKSQNCFLVALDKDTPYFYTLKQRTDDDQKTILIYEANASTANIAKTFTIYKNSYQIDLGLIITPHQEVQARVFFPAPLLQGSTKAEHIAGIIEEQDQSIIKYQLSRARRTLQDSLWAFPRLIGAEDRYFAHVLFKDQHRFMQRGYYQVLPDYIITIAEGPVIKKGTAWDMSFYIGPKEHEALNAVDSRLEVLLDYGWLSFLCKPMLTFMNWINNYVHNFGLAIIIFTLLIRLLLVPLTWPHTKNAKKMREMQNKLKYITQRYKDDPETLERERMELYKRYGMTGLSGLGGGCLPLLLQMPVFFAMNRVLSSSIELYQAPFLWIPDLSAKDPLYILPILVAVSMLLNTLVLGTAAPSDAQSKVSSFVMAILFGAFSVGFSAGLSLYIFASTFVGALQIYIQRALKLL